MAFCFIDFEAALLERRLQFAPGFVDAPCDRPGRRAEDGRRLVVGAPVDADEDEGRPQGLAQAVDALTKGAVELFALGVARGIGLGARAGLGEEPVEPRILHVDARALGSTRPEQVQREVHRDAVNPGVRLAPPVEAGEGLVRADEGLLGDVLGLRPIAQHMEREAVDAAVVATNQGVKGGEVARTRAVDELSVGRRGHAEGGNLDLPDDRGVRAGLRIARHGPPAFPHVRGKKGPASGAEERVGRYRKHIGFDR